MTERDTIERVTVKILRDVLRSGERSICRSDLKEALKCRLAQLRIPYNLDTVETAIDWVAIEAERRRR